MYLTLSLATPYNHKILQSPRHLTGRNKTLRPGGARVSRKHRLGTRCSKLAGIPWEPTKALAPGVAPSSELIRSGCSPGTR